MNFINFVKKFNKKDKENSSYYYVEEFDGIYDIDANEHGNYHIIKLEDFSIVCKLPVWLNQFFLSVEERSKNKIRKELKNILDSD